MMKVDEYKTIGSEIQSEYKIKGSLFIATGKIIRDKIEAENFLNEIRSKYFDATHNCFAYKIGYDENIEFRYSDDGEPSGTAGLPIMKIIEGFDLTNTLIVVTRYFGGTKLGTGGLVKAYSISAKNLIEKSGIKVEIIYENLILEYDYSNISKVMHINDLYSAKVIESNYDEKIINKISIRRNNIDKYKEELLLATNGKIKIN